jgi:hypothetical protein
MIPGARPGWSPSDVPSGPSAAAVATLSKPTASLRAGLEILLAAGVGMMDVPGAGLVDPANAAAVVRGAASAAVRDAEGRPADATPPEIRS